MFIRNMMILTCHVIFQGQHKIRTDKRKGGRRIKTKPAKQEEVQIRLRWREFRRDRARQNDRQTVGGKVMWGGTRGFR